MKALLQKLKLTKVESSPPPLVTPVLSSSPPTPPPPPPKPKPVPVVLGDPIELMRERELSKPKLESKPVIGLPIVSSGPIGVRQMVSVPIGSNGPSLSDYQNPPNVTYAGGRPIYLTEEADVGRWSLFPAVSNVDMAQYTFVNLPQITLPIINLVGPTGTSGVMNMTDNLGDSYPLDARDGDLYFDGEKLAKAGDWALYPAIADVDMNGKKLTYSQAFIDIGGNGGNIEINSKVGGSSIALNSVDVVTIGTSSDGNSILQTDQIVNLGGAFGNTGQFLSITETGSVKHITWVDKPVSVTEINPGGNTGSVELGSTGGSVTITNPAPGVINFEVPPNVREINPGGNTGTVELKSAGTSVIITNPTPGVINFEVDAVDVGVISLNTKTGNVDLVSTDGSVTITPIPATSNIDLSVPAIAVIEDQVATLEADVITINGEIAGLQGEVAVIQGQILGIDAELTTLSVGLGAVTTAVGVIESSYVTQVNGCRGNVQLAGAGGITISPDTGTGVITIDGSGSGGTGVSSLNTLTGGLNIVAGTGITVTPSGTDITITNTDILPFSNRTSSSTSIAIGTGFATLLSNTIVTTAPNYDIDIWGTINYTFVHTSGGTNGIVRVLFDGTPIGINQTISLDNNNTFGQVSIIASQLTASAGSHTITLQMQKSAANGTLTHVNSQLIVIGNIQ